MRKVYHLFTNIESLPTLPLPLEKNKWNESPSSYMRQKLVDKRKTAWLKCQYSLRYERGKQRKSLALRLGDSIGCLPFSNIFSSEEGLYHQAPGSISPLSHRYRGLMCYVPNYWIFFCSCFPIRDRARLQASHHFSLLKGPFLYY